MTQNSKTGAAFIAGATLAGVGVSATVGGMGLAEGFGAVGIGATTVVAVIIDKLVPDRFTELVKIDSDYDKIRQNQLFKISVNSFL